jgi:hypothetical protein
MMEFGGKRTDVVDFGGEMDYSHVKWFQDPPPRPAVRNRRPFLLSEGQPTLPVDFLATTRDANSTTIPTITTCYRTE